jgi:DNA-binding response OmpR family regulator
MQYILIADDNNDITDILSVYVKKEGYEPIIAKDGVMAEDMFFKYEPAAVLLDVMMPFKDGYEVCKSIRQKSAVPIILITARGEDYDKIMGLDIGADDYVVKPFSPSEVMARLRAVLRRINRDEVSADSDSVLRINNMEVNLDEYSFMVDGKKIPLTKKEVETMWTLAGNPNKVFTRNRGIALTREKLITEVWGYDYYGDSRTVDSHIKRLRAKIDSVEHPAWSIKTIWGVGYKFAINEEDM